jgi:hypothetical protein
MADTYRVVYGFGDYQDFPTFTDALGFYAKTRGARQPINLGRYDGSEDGNHSGLTEEEREFLP